MVGLIILHVLLLLLCVSTHPLGNEAASSYLSEIPFTRSAESIIALLHEHNVSTVHAPGSDQFQASVLLENGICFDHCPSLVLRPRSVWDVSTAVAIARMYSIPTSVRSGHQLLHLCIYLILQHRLLCALNCRRPRIQLRIDQRWRHAYRCTLLEEPHHRPRLDANACRSRTEVEGCHTCFEARLCNHHPWPMVRQECLIVFSL